MASSGAFTDMWNGFCDKICPVLEKIRKVYDVICKVIGTIVTWIYRLRGLLLAAPVVWAALKLADYNMEHLPEEVGVYLQSNGEFAMTIARDSAVYGPLGITLACLALMLFSRKAMYPWAISIFTLCLPLLLLVSNLYPA